MQGNEFHATFQTEQRTSDAAADITNQYVLIEPFRSKFSFQVNSDSAKRLKYIFGNLKRRHGENTFTSKQKLILFFNYF
jgi:hypothetical protein